MNYEIKLGYKNHGYDNNGYNSHGFNNSKAIT
jgi:hypothetical protein